jgi:transcription-repair coupling factor (superfamily II helicase)
MPRLFMGRLPNLSALAWELSHKVQKGRPFCALLPDLEWAEKLREDIQTLDFKVNTLVFPALETDMLRHRGPSSLSRWERLRCFEALSHPRPEQKTLILVPADALMQKCPPLEFFEKNSIPLALSQELNRQELQYQLARLGYLPSELVEKPGQYALRGAVLDVFPATAEYPLRLELFDDMLSSIRFFHPESQRKIADLTEFCLGPAREFIFPPLSENTSFLRQIKSILREQKRSLADREALYARFVQHSYFPEIDYWGPLILEEQGLCKNADPLEIFSPWQAIIEAHSVEGLAQAAQNQERRDLERALEEEEWVPPSEYFLSQNTSQLDLLRRTLAKAPLWLSHKQKTGLAYEPEEHFEHTLSSHSALELALAESLQGGSSPSLSPLLEEISLSLKENTSVIFITRSETQLDRLSFLLEQNGHSLKRWEKQNSFSSAPESANIWGKVGNLQASFKDSARKWSFILSDSIFGTQKKRSAVRHRKQGTRSLLSGDMALINLQSGDLVVHAEHGVGRYLGLRLMDFGGIPSELIEIEYRDNNKLFVPVTRLSLVQRHSAPQESIVLDRLGGQSWEQKKTKARKDLRSIAGELLHLYSLREMARGPSIQPDPEKIEAFAAQFPFTETEDQLKAIEAGLKDLAGPTPMDRLLCGDVGYGKTEVAMRLAHACAIAGYQVAVLVPTTLLAVQHEASFKKRLSSFGIRVEGLSRFKTAREKEKTIKDLKEGTVSIVVGTHSLLGPSIQFKKLGLLVVDEEQKFGVSHKEKIKRLKNNVHVLSMSATPIPRTLNMAMSGLKELSLISTPPQDRISVRTHIARKNADLIREAVLNEIRRGGQVFYVHNRVQTIQREYEYLKELLPQTKIEYVHGQMEERQLEARVLSFYKGETELLLTTSIIESGLDIPSANTLIVDRSDHFGLSQLYQLRGRVGRSSERAYAYFLRPEKGKITDEAEQRLSVLETYQELGSGFHIASHDLEIRGAGDLLGRQQSGSISALGFEAYAELLQECIADLRGEHFTRTLDPDIQIPIDSTIPEHYIPEIGLRLMAYRRLAASLEEEEIDQIIEELEDRFGALPESVENLTVLMRIKCQLRRLGIRSAVASKTGVSLSFDEQTPVDPTKMIESIKKYPSHYQLTPEGKLLIKQPANALESRDVVRSVERALAQLESWCA